MPYTNVISQTGPLPIVGNMTVTAPNQLLVVAGSAFTTNVPGAELVMEILVDTQKVGECRMIVDLASQHLTFVPAFIPMALTPASSPFAVTLRVSQAANYATNTVTDKYDRFEVLLIE